MTELAQGFRSVSEASRKFVRDTAVGRLIATRYDVVQWSAVQNEFARRAKQGYDENLLLDHLSSYSYDERAVADILDSVLIKCLVGAEEQKVDTLAGLWKSTAGADKTFVITDRNGAHGKFLCTIWCHSVRAANVAASLFTDAYSQLGIVGVAHPTGKDLHLSVHSQEDHHRMVSIIHNTGLERLRTHVMAPRMQIFTGGSVLGLAVCLPKFERGADLIASVPDTFTEHVEDESKVLVSDGSTLAGRSSLGCFVSTEAASKASAAMLQDYKEQVLDENIGEFYGTATIASRNVLIFSKLVERGFMARSSWANVINEVVSNETYLEVSV